MAEAWVHLRLRDFVPPQLRDSNFGCVGGDWEAPVWGWSCSRTARPPAARPATWDQVQEKSEQAGSGTLTHPILDKIGTKWVAIKDLDSFLAGFYAEFRRESF